MVVPIIKSILILIILLVAVPVPAAELQVVLDQTRVELEESFSLELRATGNVDGKPDLSVLEEDFELLGRSRSSQVQVINGEISRSTTWSLALLARSVGSKLIPPLCVGNDCSEPVAIEVLPVGQGHDSEGTDSNLLLEASAEPAKLRVQSQLLYKVQLLTRIGVLDWELTEPKPVGVEAVVENLGQDRRIEVNRNGLRYNGFERTYVIFPQQSGRLTIPPVRFTAEVRAGQSSSYPYRQRTKKLRKYSNEINIEVRAAEELNGRPWLPANRLSLSDDWQSRPPQLTVGEPVTRTLTLHANGLPAAQLPQFPLEVPDSLKSYPDKPSRKDQYGPAGVAGILQQKLALVPTRPGKIILPEITVDWWDLKNERWQQARLPEVELEVLPAAGQPAVEPSQTALLTTPAPDALPPISSPDSPAIDNSGFWFWLSLVLGLGWFLTLLLLLRLLSIRRPNQQILQPEQKNRPELITARQELFRVLQTDNPTEVRTALLVWGQALYPDERPENLEQLAACSGAPLEQQLNELSRKLYSQSSVHLEEAELMAAVKLVEQQCATKSEHSLPPLYPSS